MTYLVAIPVTFAIVGALLGVGCRARRELLDRELHYAPANLESGWADEVYLCEAWEDSEFPMKVTATADVTPSGAWKTFVHVWGKTHAGSLYAAKLGLGVLYASQLSKLEKAIVPLGRIDPGLHIKARNLLRGKTPLNGPLSIDEGPIS